MDFMDWMTPSNSLFLANTTNAAFARGLFVSGVAHPIWKTLSYFSLIFLQFCQLLIQWIRQPDNILYGWRRSSRHHIPNWRRRMTGEEKQNEYYNYTWE